MNRFLTPVTLCAIFVCIATSPAPAEFPEVTTLAGSGAPGLSDGPASSATFMFPVGIAAATDGSIYVSDSATQRIRFLSTSGRVSTVAGSGALEPPGLIVRPGYHDGEALHAQFNEPEGLAIGPDGALYIADSGNFCIRKLSNGQVTTVLGNASKADPVDGPIGAARLKHPKAIAFDGGGAMYVADDGVGLRKLSGGVLTTIHLKSFTGGSALGLTIVDGADPIILLTTLEGVVEYHPATGTDQIFSVRTPDEGGLFFSTPNQIIALDRRQFVYTDVLSQNIRYLRLPAPPFVINASTRVIAGSALERPMDNAGFANGSRFEARFYAPMGIAKIGNRIIVADAGNRRIRQIMLPRTRLSETGLDPANAADGTHYEIALIGGTWTFSDSFDQDSICAHIETTLNRSRRFRKPVRCRAVAIDGARAPQIDEYIRTVFSKEHMDLVVIDGESWAYTAPNGLLPNNTPANVTRSQMQQLIDVLNPVGTRVAVVWAYPAEGAHDWQWIGRTTFKGMVDRPRELFRPVPLEGYRGLALQTQNALRGLHILQYDTHNDLVRYEIKPDALPLFHADDPLPNPRGNAFLGDHLASALLEAGLGKP